MNHGKKRSISQHLTIALIITKNTIKRLLFSKKTFGIILLCLIPIIVFSLWSAGVFPQEEERFYTTNWRNIPELAVKANDENISVEIQSWDLDIEYSVDQRMPFNLYLNGTTNGPVDHLAIKIYMIFSEDTEFVQPFNLIGPINFSENGSLHGPIITEKIIFSGIGPNGPNITNNWSSWEFKWDNMVPFQLPFDAPGDFDQIPGLNDLSEFAPRLGIYIRAYSGNISSEPKWNFVYKEMYLKFEEDKIKVGEVGKDIEIKEYEADGYEVFFEVSLPIFFLLIIPLIAILYSISAIREDIEKHTIVYLITRPVSKTEIIFYKFKGYFISAWIPLILSISISFFIAASKEGGITLHLDYLGTVLLMMTLCLLAYGAIFFIFSQVSSYPIVLSLLYVYFWEFMIWQIPNSLSRFSILYHIHSMGHDLLGEVANVQVFQPFSAAESFLALCGSIIGFFIVAIYIFNKRDLG
jgi:ABC-type transport system involved in multi-copper enzyme maturation permease subunit